MKWGFLSRNPTLASDPLPTAIEHAARRQTMQVWSAEDLRACLEATTDDVLHPLWFVPASTGLRRSEVLGLRWSDVDLERRLLSVRQTLREADAGRFALEEDHKSRRSARVIHIDTAIIDALRQQRAQQAQWREGASGQWRNLDLVFSDFDGTWFDPDRISKTFRRACRRAKVRSIRLHDLRHAHATLL